MPQQLAVRSPQVRWLEERVAVAIDPARSALVHDLVDRARVRLHLQPDLLVVQRTPAWLSVAEVLLVVELVQDDVPAQPP
eukprot:13675814-Heterocapsa_arctica.AAC.1